MPANRDPIRVGIVGLGRSGMNIHADAIGRISELFEVAGVFDPMAERRESCARELGAKAYASEEALFGAADIEMIVVASPNAAHAPHSVAALNAGKHVLCEKPFGLTVAEVDAMIAAAQNADKLLQPFQQRRYEVGFQKVKAICASGVLGEIKLIRSARHAFHRRWDWQTLASQHGGALNNNGPHQIDQVMELFGEAEPRVWCETKCCLTSGDAEDYLKIILTAPDRPTVEIELMDCIAYPQDRWFINGTAGGLRGNDTHLEWRWVDWSKMPDRAVSTDPTPDRSYNSEQIEWQSGSWDADPKKDFTYAALSLYKDLWRTIREGQAQVITPESIRRRVDVMDKARAAAASLEPATV